MNTYADRLLDLTLRLPGPAVIAACGAFAALLGWSYVDRPTLAVFPALLLLSLPLMVSARARLLVVVFGALTVFQSSDELTAPKLLYLFALGISFGAAMFRLPRLVGTPAFEDLRPMFRASVAMFAIIVASLPLSILNEVPQKDWLRDVAPYVLVACAPLFALDAQASFSDRALRRLLVVGGTVGAVGFTARWLTNRQIADFSFVPVGLPTLLLASTVFAYGFAALLHGNRHRLAWAALTAVVFAMLLSTGTRTALILLAAPLAIVVGSRYGRTQRSIRFLVAAPLVAVLVLVGAQAIVRVTNADTDALTARARLVFSTGERSEDRSYVDRLSQTASAWEAFRSSPVMGRGPGQPFVWSDSFGDQYEWMTIDSPVSFLAKFGILGVLVAGFLVIGYIGTMRSFRARTGLPTTLQLALLGFGAVVVAWSLLQNAFEDKGFAIGLILLLAAAAREASDAARRDAHP